MKARFKVVAIFLLLGLLVSIGAAMLCAAVVDIDLGNERTATRGEWTVTTITATGAMRVSSRWATASWGPGQATGAPDTPSSGDFSSAWASQSHDGSTEWLIVEYDAPIRATSLDVYESYNPGGLTRITMVDDQGAETELWAGTDPSAHETGLAVSPIDLRTADGAARLIHRLKLYVGVAGVAAWREIDAVGLVDDAGATHWADRATASSWYGGTAASASGGPPEELTPSWSGLAAHFKASAHKGNWDEQVVDARGWPMLALYSRHATQAPASLSKVQYFSSPVSPSSGTSRPRIAWPWQPIWIGLLVDSIFYGGVLGLAWTVAVTPRKFIREVSRLKRGCCVRCGYDLEYDFVRGCPECGWRRGPNG